MKLDNTLKLYIGLCICLYVCFMLSWLIWIPMIMHGSKGGECLLFVTPHVTYGPAAGYFIVYVFINIIYNLKLNFINEIILKYLIFTF